MKKLSKVLSLALAGVLLTSAAALPANAASASLGKVSNVKVTSVDDDEIKLKWNKVKGASGYQIYVRQGSKGSWRLAETTTKTRDEADDLYDATGYSVKVRAYKNTRSGRVYGKFSKVIKASTDPDEVQDLSYKKVSSKKIKLSWNAVPGADGYRVYKYNSATGEWDRVAKTSKTSKNVSVSVKGGERFRVRAYVDYNDERYYGDASDSVKYVGKSASNGSVSKAQAKQIALKDAGVSRVYDYEIEKDWENGRYVYEVSFNSGRYDYEYIIDCANGNIIHEEKEWDD
ncbi:MAG: PepSY domain-containing protein [Clostridia bacterium]|nr:PepSY domain-containing protein [Clostridia bacterium]